MWTDYMTWFFCLFVFYNKVFLKLNTSYNMSSINESLIILLTFHNNGDTTASDGLQVHAMNY